MVRVELDTHRLAVVVGILQRGGNKIVLCVDTAIVAQRQRPVERGVVYGPPEVDDLETTLQELGDVLGWEMAANASGGGLGCLVDVNLGYGLALLWAVVDFSGAAAANG